MGTINIDWNKFGYSEILGFNSKKIDVKNFKLKSNGKIYTVKNFGVRAFLMRNLRIKDIDHRIMMDFKELDREKIPDIRGKFGKWPDI